MKPKFSDHWSCDNPIKNGKVLRKTKCEIACLQGFDLIAGMPQFEILLNFDIWSDHELTKGYQFSVREAHIKMKSVLWQIELIIISSILFNHFPMNEKQLVKSKWAPGTAWVLMSAPLIRSASKYRIGLGLRIIHWITSDNITDNITYKKVYSGGLQNSPMHDEILSRIKLISRTNFLSIMMWCITNSGSKMWLVLEIDIWAESRVLEFKTC